jgi:hypothetical protein
MLKPISQDLSNFFFASIPVNIICMYRIFIGAVSLAWGLLLAPTFLIWFGPSGLLSIETAKALGMGTRTLLNPIVWFNLNEHALIGMLCLYIAAAICLTIGCCTRLSTILVWSLMVSFANRNGYILNGGDALLRLALFILIFAPAGRMYSLDSWLRKRFNPNKEVSLIYEPWAQRLLQLQLAILYWEAFWAKINGQDWWNGTAVYYVTHLSEFHFLPVPWLFDQLWTCKLLTWGTLLFEMSMWSLIWFKPFRYWLLLLGVFVHMLFNWALNIPLFQFVVLAHYILFVETSDMQRVFTWIKKKVPIHQQLPWLVRS